MTNQNEEKENQSVLISEGRGVTVSLVYKLKIFLHEEWDEKTNNNIYIMWSNVKIHNTKKVQDITHICIHISLTLQDIEILK